MFTIGAFAIILDEQSRVLLCHRRDIDLWNLPGGGVLRGEAPWQAAIREVKEEVGLDVVVQRLAGVYMYRSNDIVFSFVCEVTGGEPTLSDEADAIAYFAFDQFPPCTYTHHVARVKDVLERPGQFHMVQDMA